MAKSMFKRMKRIEERLDALEKQHMLGLQIDVSSEGIIEGVEEAVRKAMLSCLKKEGE